MAIPSEQTHRKVIEPDPENAGACYEEAEQAYCRAIELVPNDPSLWKNLGDLLHDHLSRFDEAEKAYRKAIALDPEDPAAWNNLGDLLQKHLLRPDAAAKAYCKAIELTLSGYSHSKKQDHKSFPGKFLTTGEKNER